MEPDLSALRQAVSQRTRELMEALSSNSHDIPQKAAAYNQAVTQYRVALLARARPRQTPGHRQIKRP